MDERRHGLVTAALSVAVAATLVGIVYAQPPASVALRRAAAAGAEHQVTIPEGTEVRVHFNEQLSSATAAAGDEFSITTEDPITLPDGTVIAPGYRGKGEVTTAEHRGMMGKAGQLSVRFDYIRIGDAHVRLRGSKGEEGKSGVTSTVVLTVLFGPLGLIKHGSDVVIQKGQTVTAFVDEDAAVTTPIPPPPVED